jgi:hypothetical protein
MGGRGGSGGGAGGGGGNGAAGVTGVDRTFGAGFGWTGGQKPEDCSVTGTCSSGTCFRLTPDLAVCSPTAQLPANQCSVQTGFSIPDECGCGGLTCAAGATCVSVALTCSCQPTSYNACVETACASPTDCGGGSVCTPTAYILPAPQGTSFPTSTAGRCFAPACASDAVCADGVAGRCALVLSKPNPQQGDLRLVGVRCVYSGPPTDASACAGTTAAGAESFDHPSGATGYGFHTCPDLAH